MPEVTSAVKQEVTYKNHPLSIEKVNDNKSYIFFKRVLDIIIASIGLLVLFIPLVIIAIAIKIEDPKGPVFFSQTRIGKNGKEFKILKFRSMVSDAEDKLQDLLKYNEIQGAMFKMKDDPRITRIGKFIRRKSIDEFPQFINVLKGEMSIVGPRPPLPREVEEYTDYHKQRLLVTPGCTGLWQVSGRNDLNFEEMVELDLQYIKNRNILYDFKIILKTFLVILGDKSAF